MPENIKFCCEQHADLAFDDFIVETETFPVLEPSENQTCSYCNKPAAYKLILSTAE